MNENETFKEQKKLAILILIGGKSKRFGTEKGLFEFHGKPLILHQIETLAIFDEDIYLVAHTLHDINEYYKKIEYPKDVDFIIDDEEVASKIGVRTPLLGVYSGFRALNKLNFKKAFLLSCDMPLIKSDVIEHMIEQSKGYDCCIPRWKNGYTEPLFAIYPVKETYLKAEEILETSHYGLNHLLGEDWNINFISVEESIKPLDENLVSLININSPIDLEKLVKSF
ncbi:MAG: NTP transferase domain-containing protein [Candidatus Lokiarchaeota archaeon]|nr:NTP transferase domain-containing protein [Candidatus Lokiarchaeota archaeon]MBD3341394.1 NTP transferase domain-containing protein [Candidatus Lokiarchaeota archaeon]